MRNTDVFLPGCTIGVMGGGQLGRMFAIAARRMGYRIHTFSPDEDSPTGQLADREVAAAFDDEAAVQEGMAALLRRWKCDVLTAGSGAEMMSKLVAVQRLPDLIVSDYRLRDNENGIQVVETLRSEFNVDIPALLVTGDTGPDRLRDAEASGLPILHKPLNPARLRTLIANLLREHTRAA